MSFTDSLPAGLSVAPTPNASTTCTDGAVTAAAGTGLVTLTGATINPNTNCQLQVDVTASVLGAYTNTIAKETVTSVEGFKNQNDAVATLNVLNPPVITKAFSPAAVKAGQASTLTVTIANANAQTLNGVALTDSLPSGLTIGSDPNASTTCVGGAVAAAVADTSLALTNATVPANGSCSFRADVVSNVAGAYVNTVPAKALVTTEGVTNTAPGNATLTVLQPPTVAKAFNPTTINQGATSRLTITLGNPNASPITLGAALTDTLPGALTVATPNGLAGTCTQGSVTAVAGSNSVTYANGATIPAGGCTISVLVTGVQVSNNLNLIPVGGLDTTAGANQAPATATLDVAIVPVSLGSFIWRDLNGDGHQDLDEPGIAGVTVQLLDNNGAAARDLDGNLVPTQTTSSDGRYFFSNLPAGGYQLEVTPPAGYVPTANQSTGAIDAANNANNVEGDSNIAGSAAGVYRSGLVTLTAGSEPTETGDYSGDHQDDSADTNGNTTVDFGFRAYDLALRKTVLSLSNQPLIPGTSTVTFQIEVFNQGDIPATNLELIDYVQTGLAYDPLLNTGGGNR